MLYSAELHNLYSSPNKIRVIKSGTIGWAKNAVRMEEMREMHTIFWLENLKGRDHLEDLRINERRVSERVFEK